MMLGIVDREGSFSDRWKEYCQIKNIPFRVIDIYSSNLVEECKDLDAVLWNWAHYNFLDQLLARQIIHSLELAGLIVFPSTATCWHYDDKLAQKYLFDAIGAPSVPTYIFYDLKKALSWVESAEFPKVFKLSRGAGSYNVHLVKNKEQAKRLCKIAFSRGFDPSPSYFSDAKTKISKVKSLNDLIAKIKRMPDIFLKEKLVSIPLAREKGYVYFQDFMPSNTFDTRIAIVGNRAFAYHRKNRKDDFRASGAGFYDQDPSKIDLDFVRLGFDIANSIESQCLALDFVYNPQKQPVVLELSHTFHAKGSAADCPGHWDVNLDWHEGKMYPQDGIIDDILAALIDHPKPLTNH